MSDRPTAVDLLAIARETLLREIMPHLPADHHVTGLMIASAMAIAKRECEAGMDQPVAPAWTVPFGGLAGLTAAIRGGSTDYGVWRNLLADAEARVAIANPKYR